jgi:hypothetical protein
MKLTENNTGKRQEIEFLEMQRNIKELKSKIHPIIQSSFGYYKEASQEYETMLLRTLYERGKFTVNDIMEYIFTKIKQYYMNKNSSMQSSEEELDNMAQWFADLYVLTSAKDVFLYQYWENIAKEMMNNREEFREEAHRKLIEKMVLYSGKSNILKRVLQLITEFNSSQEICQKYNNNPPNVNIKIISTANWPFHTFIPQINIPESLQAKSFTKFYKDMFADRKLQFLIPQVRNYYGAKNYIDNC